MDLLQGDQIGLFGDVEPVTNQGERVENDYYPTPEAITKVLLSKLGGINGAVFEPCAGQGAISDVVSKLNPEFEVLESDLRWGGNSPRDATTKDFWDYWSGHSLVNHLGAGVAFDWVITNPPFNCAAQILEYAWEYCETGCAFLLRLSFLEPTGNRSEMLKAMSDHMRYVIPVSPRPKFRRDTNSSDSVTCAWFVWDKRWSWAEQGMQSPFQFVSGWR
jgi:hypothetical protein